MIKAHIIYIPFTGLGLHNGYRGDIWLENRIKIFKNFVLPSLLNQTNLHFTLVFSWRPEERENPIVQRFYEHMGKIDRMTPVFTYGGLCFWDDKYPDNIARERLFINLKRTLPELKQHVDHADEVLFTINPSDDMYMSEAVETIQNTDFEDNKVIGWQKGYIMNYATKEVANYEPDTITPFFTIRFPKDIFLDPEKHMEWSGPYRSHEYVKELRFKSLKGRGFVVGIHGANISTTWNTFRGQILSKEEVEKVLLQTGTFFSEPVIIKQSTRLLLRKIFNLLPFNKFIRKMYHYAKFN